MRITPIDFLIKVQEQRKFHSYNVFLFIFFVGIVRTVLERILFDYLPVRARDAYIIIPFYMQMYFGTLIILWGIAGIRTVKMWNVALIGLFIGLFPPLIDVALPNSAGLLYSYYYYLFQKVPNLIELFSFTLSPRTAMPLGETIAIWLTIFSAAYYTAIRKKSWVRVILVFFFMYILFQMTSVILPSAIHLMKRYLSKIGQVKPATFVGFYYAGFQIFFSFFVIFYVRGVGYTYLKRRLAHILPFLAILSIGVSVRGQWGLDAFALIFAAFLLFLGIAVSNDYYDKESSHAIDDVVFQGSFILITFMLVFLSAYDFAPTLALMAIAVTSVLYNADFYKAKRFFLSNIKIEAVWGGGSFLAGLMLDPKTPFSSFQLWLLFLFFGGWSIVNMLKDAKDIHQDFHERNDTVYVKFHRRGIPLKKIHRVVLSLYYLCFLVPLLYFVGLRDFWVSGILCLVLSFMVFANMRFGLKGYRVQLLLSSVYLFIIAGALA